MMSEDDPVRRRARRVEPDEADDRRRDDATEHGRDDVRDVLDRELDREQLVAVVGVAVLGQERRR